MDVDGAFITYIASVYEHDNWLYIGNLVGDYISVFDLNLIQKNIDADGESNSINYEL